MTVAYAPNGELPGINPSHAMIETVIVADLSDAPPGAMAIAPAFYGLWSLQVCALLRRGMADSASRVAARLFQRLGDSRPVASLASEARGLLDDTLALGGRLGTGALATALAVSEPHLCRSFRRQYGMTVSEYNCTHRVVSASSLLWSSQASLLEIAMSCGYSDQPHLTRAIAAAYSISPRPFRSLSPYFAVLDRALQPA